MIEPEAETDGTYFGCTVAAGPDANGDGMPEVLVAARGGEIRAYSPLDGKLLWKSAELGPDEGFFGPPVVSIGDVTGDGCTDVAVGQFREAGLETDPGLVRILSGREGTLIRSIEPGLGVQGFGSSVLAYPDIDGDGADEIVVNSPSAGAYDVHVISTRDGSVLMTRTLHWEWDWIEPGRNVDPHYAAVNYSREHDDDSRHMVADHHLGDVGDRDSDGFPEIAACSPGLPAEVRIHSGKTLELLRTHTLRDSVRAWQER